MKTRAQVESALLGALLSGVAFLGWAAPPDKSGVKPSVISLPSGAGAIEGLGESFEPQLNTGASSYGVAIALPPGRARLAPKLRLVYNSNLGNSMAGLGWGLELPSIKRQTDKGFPAYDPSDVFLFEGEELVPLDNIERDWRCENESQFNRFRQIDTDGDSRVDAWEMTDRNGTRFLFGQHRGNNHQWSTVVKAIEDERTTFDKTYAWALDTTIDLHGNRIEYDYLPPEGDATSSAFLYPLRIRYSLLEGNYHEVRFRYENRPDVFDDYRPTFSIRIGKRISGIDVLSHYDGAIHAVRSYDLEYAYRPEDQVVLTTGAQDLGISTLKRLVQRDRTGNPGNYLPPLLFEYSQMVLEQAALHAVDPAPVLEIAREDGTVQFADVNGDGLPDLFQTTEFDQRFCLNLGETGPSGSRWLQFSAVYSTNRAGSLQLQLPESGLADFDADGLVDYIQIFSESVTGGKRIVVFPNAARLDRFEPWPPGFALSPIELFGTPAAISLDHPSMRQMDVNFDKISDFVSLEPGLFVRFNYYYRDASGTWQTLSKARDDMPGGLSFALNGVQNPAVHLADMNGDRLQDLVYLEKTGVGAGAELRVRYWPYCALGEWAPVRDMELSAGDTFQVDALDLADVLVQDLTGDGLADVAILNSDGGDASRLELRVNSAGHRWSPPFFKAGLPRYQPRDSINATTFRQADLNGNGSTDLIWRNQTGSENSWHWLELVPKGKPNLLVRIDNSQGKRTEITYGDAVEDMIRAREKGYPWRTRCPVPIQVVRRIRTTCGQDLDGIPDTPGRTTDNYVSEFQYRDPFYDGFEKEFRGFAFAQRVDFGDDFLLETNLTTLNPSPGWSAGKTPTGQVSGPTLVTRFRYLTGASDEIDNDEYPSGWVGPRVADERATPGGGEEEILKGKQIWEEKLDPWALQDPTGSASFDRGAFLAVASASAEERARLTPDAFVYSRVRQTWRVRRLYRPDDPSISPPGRFAAAAVPVKVRSGLGGSGRSVSFAFASAITNELIEANGLLRGALGYPTRSPAWTAESSDVDDYGNTVEERSFGVIEDESIDDERFTWTDFVLRGEALERWTLGKPARIRLTDERGAFVSETRYYYDGGAFQGLPLGEMGSRGLLHRTEQVVTGETPPPDIGAPSDLPGDPRLPAGHVVQQTRNAYDDFGNVIATLDPLGEPDNPASGHARHIVFDPLFQIHPVEERIVVGGGNEDLVMRAGYDPGFGTLTHAEDFNGHRTTFEYDSFARLVAIVKPYDSAEFPTTLFEYMPADPNRAWIYRYDRAGNLTIETSGGTRPSNRVVTRFRENSGQPGFFVTVAYSDGCGRVLAEVKEGDSPGKWIVISTHSYNRRMGVQSDWLPYEIAYGTDDSDPPHLSQLWPSGRPPQSSLDGRLIVRSDKRFDPTGREIITINPPETWGAKPSPFGGGEMERTRSLKEFLPLETRLFDENDSDPNSAFAGTPMVQFTDGLGRLIRVREVVRLKDDGTPAGALHEWPTRYQYDLNDKLVHIRDSQDNEKWFRHDGLGRPIFMNDPDRGVMFYTYDDASNVREIVDAKRQRITCTYDGANRLLTEDYHDEVDLVAQASNLQVTTLPASSTAKSIPSGARFSYHRSPDVRYHYDTPAGLIDLGDNSRAKPSNTRGCLAWVADTSGEEHNSYDARGRVAYVVKRIPDPQPERVLSQPASYLISYKTGFDYDSMDRLIRVAYPDNDEVRYEYSSRNRVHRIPWGPNGSVISGIEYQLSDQPARIEYGNGVQTTYQYDPRLRLIKLLTARAGAIGTSNELIHFDYTFDGAGNITRIDDQRPGSVVPAGDKRRNTQFFDYDDLYRLTRVQYSFHTPGMNPRDDGEIRYCYDRIGNMLSQTSSIDHQENGRSVVDLGDMASGGSAGRSGRMGRGAGDPPGPHALSEIRNPKSEIRNYSYDDNGNMLDLDGLACTWDFKDRLVAVENEEMRAEYTYDYTDRRITKRVQPKATAGARAGIATNHQPPTTIYVDKYFEVREHDAPVKYVWNGDTRVARVTGSLSANPRVQRIRLWPGWNLISVGVDGATLASTAHANKEVGILAAYRWEQSSHSWLPVASNDSLPAGAVLWLNAANHGTMVVSGAIKEMSDQRFGMASQFLPGNGEEPIQLHVADAALSEQASVWLFQGDTQSWETYLPESLNVSLDHHKTLPVGQALFAREEDPSILIVPDPALRIRYYHQDHLASTSVMTDMEVNVLSTKAHYPYGNPKELPASSQSSALYTFTQKEQDIESGHYYFEARYHQGAFGRFVRFDPALLSDKADGGFNPQRLNPYSYSLNRPITHNDPDGEVAQMIVGAVVGMAVDVASQVVAAKVQGVPVKINVYSVIISGGIGALTGGASSVVAAKAIGQSLFVRAVAQGAVGAAGNAIQETANQLSDRGSVNANAVGKQALFGFVGSSVATSAGGFSKQLVQSQLTKRISQDMQERGVEALSRNGSAVLNRTEAMFSHIPTLAEDLVNQGIEVGFDLGSQAINASQEKPKQ